jgi:hypothetical protein
MREAMAMGRTVSQFAFIYGYMAAFRISDLSLDISISDIRYPKSIIERRSRRSPQPNDAKMTPKRDPHLDPKLILDLCQETAPCSTTSRLIDLLDLGSVIDICRRGSTTHAAHVRHATRHPARHPAGHPARHAAGLLCFFFI